MLVGVSLGEAGLVEGTSAGFFGSSYATIAVPLPTDRCSFEFVASPHAVLAGYLLSTPDFAILLRDTSLRVVAFGLEAAGPALPKVSGLGKYHIVLSWEPGHLRLMVNGSLVLDQTGFAGPASASQRVTLGARLLDGTPVDLAYAVVGEVAVYATALTPAQAEAHFTEINASPDEWPPFTAIQSEQEPSMPVNRSQMAAAAADVKAKAEALHASLQAFCALSPSLLDYEGGMGLRSACEYNHPAVDQITAAADATAVWLTANPEE